MKFFLLGLLSGPPEHPLLRSESANGSCRVMCFHPRSDMTLPRMSIAEVRAVIDRWAEVNVELGQTHAWVQVIDRKYI